MTQPTKTIIPISLRMPSDVAKEVYSYAERTDRSLNGAITSLCRKALRLTNKRTAHATEEAAK